MTDDPTWTIYGLRLTGTTEIRYVGQTKTLERRLYLHRWHATTATRPPGLPVHKWIAAKGADNIEHVILEQLNPAVGKEALDDAERRHIAELRNAGHRLLNLTDGGEGTHGYTGTPEKNQAHAERMRGEGNPRYGTTWTPELREKIAAAKPDQSGENNPRYGVKLSDETRAKISANHADIRGEKNPYYGRKHSEETRAKMKRTPEQRAAISERMRRQAAARTPEQVAAIAAKQRATKLAKAEARRAAELLALLDRAHDAEDGAK